METKMIYKRMIEVMKSIGVIGKTQVNQFQKYNFRGIDDVFNALNKPMSTAGIFLGIEVLESKEQFFENKDKHSIWVKLKVKYTFYCADDGSSLSSIVEGEAIDQSDKATNKAMQAALKYMILQTFCIPTEDMLDADKENPAIPSHGKLQVPERIKEIINKQEQKPTPIKYEASDHENYVIKFGKHKDKTIAQVGIPAARNYRDFLVSGSEKDNKPLFGSVKEFVEVMSQIEKKFQSERDAELQRAIEENSEDIPF